MDSGLSGGGWPQARLGQGSGLGETDLDCLVNLCLYDHFADEKNILQWPLHGP